MVAPEAVSVVEEPLQITPDAALPVTVGRAVTLIAMVLLLLQPEVVPVTVYVIEELRVDVTLLPDVGLKLVTGSQL